MSTNSQTDPVTLAKELFEKHEVIYDAEKDSGGETVPTPDLKKVKDPTKKTKKNVTKPSDADDQDVDDTEKIKTNKTKKENFELDVEEAINSIGGELDDMNALFRGEQLSNSFKEKARTIFETAVKARVKDIAVALEFQASNKLAEAIEANKSELTESLDDYLSYVVEEWVSENQVALDRGIKSDIAESFMMGLKNLFEAHYIDMPDEKYDVVTDLEDKIGELESKVNEEIQKNVALNRSLSNADCSEVFNEVSNSLVHTQREKLAKLAEGIEYRTTNQFRNKLNVLKESYFGAKPQVSRASSLLNEFGEEDTMLEDTSGDAKFLSQEIKRYSAYMDRESKHNNY